MQFLCHFNAFRCFTCPARTNNFLDALSVAIVKRSGAPANNYSSAIISPGPLTGSTNEPKPSKPSESPKVVSTPGEAFRPKKKKHVTDKGKRPAPSEHHPSNN